MSHLSDQQIIEIDSEHPHLQSCDSCKQKWVHRQSIKQRLVDSVKTQAELNIQTKQSIPDWEAFSLTMPTQNEHNEVSRPKVLSFLRYQSSLITRRSALGLAASLLLVTVFLQSNSNRHPVSKDLETAQLIEQNSQLQSQWQARQKSLWATEQIANSQIDQSNQQLLLLDDEIQKAYLAKLDKNTIRLLWQKRMLEMERLIATPSGFLGPKPINKPPRTLNI